MTKEEAREIFLNRGYIQVKGGRIYDGDKWRESVVVISKWLEQEPCEDAISRKAVLDCLTATGLKKFDFILDARDKIKNLPPVTPRPKMGRWIVVETLHGEWEGTKKYACNDCGERVGVFKSNYCPNCGAKMLPTDSEKE